MVARSSRPASAAPVARPPRQSRKRKFLRCHVRYTSRCKRNTSARGPQAQTHSVTPPPESNSSTNQKFVRVVASNPPSSRSASTAKNLNRQFRWLRYRLNPPQQKNIPANPQQQDSRRRDKCQ